MTNRMKNIKKTIKGLSLILLTATFFTACKTPKDVAYFQDLTVDSVITNEANQIKIEPNDKLSIFVKTNDPTLSSMFNLQVYTDRTTDYVPFTAGRGNVQAGQAMGQGFSRYTVTPEGTIDFPYLGDIKVEGMTRSELSGFIKGELMGKNLVKDAIVTVEFVNMGVSIVGEVKNPGRYDINQDRINVIEALSMAGDLDIQGRRDNIKVIRETEEGLQTYNLDLTNFKELAQSPGFYLNQGDIIYVEPNDMRKRQTTTNGNNVYSTSFWISVASLLTTVVTTIGVFVVK